ncbi:hypothetical protein W97_01002 [Coniosporium apollinis CBS 100218]|uniref:Velvet domain-containing protein n=1 Tax=Coniosporium apollinis (strain CBS 100218) TaxID=1168221 RepID=R7YIP7_CONA1|nr:uncharacterized protein W97_01002 [Coniosporium apollinis CBS 100218]EON61785.1 hypothetical protein W97_01002 [Coniosporium apollinis CBS 100218]
MATIIPVSNETRSGASRMTREGRKIRYEMNVIQQPERARACGSGAKSSADRRPVDPPPIVELKVFEDDVECTFSYNANFFLFATLENARTMAQGRVPQASASFPVLTGTPVAGMAYLDRPNPAGYFIFPDLSVRHEGKYRLSFALYEELKEAKDMDPEDHMADVAVRPDNINAHVSHRLEVKSAPFTVFSAKKFPGLTESTALSRMVAEQGCRVRIRRDVRMRRRDNKSSKDWDDYEDETAYERARRTATPDAYGQSAMPTPQPPMGGSDRPRSVSNASNGSYAVPERRTSLQDMAQSYQQAFVQQMGPPAPQNAYPQMPYGPPQPQQYQSQYPPQQPMMQPPQAPYQQPQHSYQHPSMQMPQAYGYLPTQQYAQPQYEHSPHHMRHDTVDFGQAIPGDYRRAPMNQPQPQQYQTPTSMMNPAPFGSSDNLYSRAPQMSIPSQPIQAPQPTLNTPAAPLPSAPAVNGHSLAPLKTLQPPTEKLEPVSPSYQMPGSLGENYHEGPRAAPPKFATQPSASGATKRTYSSTFDTQHIEQPMRQGARPDLTRTAEDFANGGFEEGDDIETPDAGSMSYRRADGTHRSRRVALSR